MTERGVDYDRHLVVGVLGDELAYRLVQLLEARQGTTLGGEVGTVDYYLPS